MTTSAGTAALLPLAQLPRTPASDLQKIGWREMIATLRSDGDLLVANHDKPEAVIIAAVLENPDAASRLQSAPSRSVQDAWQGESRLRILMTRHVLYFAHSLLIGRTIPECLETPVLTSL